MASVPAQQPAGVSQAMDLLALVCGGEGRGGQQLTWETCRALCRNSAWKNPSALLRALCNLQWPQVAEPPA